MTYHSFFYIFFGIVLLQRGLELVLAKRNERKLKSQGAYEVGKRHYPLIVCCHVLFFITLFIEVTYFKPALSMWWFGPFALFLLAQVLRVWAISSLGTFWNTKILILPGAKPVEKGPYKFLRHPNYVIVMLEILMIPLIFKAYFTAVMFTFLNMIVLTIRISTEEKALREATNYEEVFQAKERFIPKLRND